MGKCVQGVEADDDDSGNQAHSNYPCPGQDPHASKRTKEPEILSDANIIFSSS